MASKSLQAVETSTTWQDSGGDKVMDIQSAVSGTTEIGAYLDLGTAPRANLYEIVVFLDGTTGSVNVGRTVELRFAQSNSTTGFDGEPTTDPTSSAVGTISNDQNFNTTPVGFIRNHTLGSTSVMQSRFVVKLTGRYVAPTLRNNLASTLHASNTHTITLTPIPQEAE